MTEIQLDENQVLWQQLTHKDLGIKQKVILFNQPSNSTIIDRY